MKPADCPLVFVWMFRTRTYQICTCLVLGAHLLRVGGLLGFPVESLYHHRVLLFCTFVGQVAIAMQAAVEPWRRRLDRVCQQTLKFGVVCCGEVIKTVASGLVLRVVVHSKNFDCIE